MTKKTTFSIVITLLIVVLMVGCSPLGKQFTVSTSVTNQDDKQSIFNNFGQDNHLTVHLKNGSESKRLKTTKDSDVVELSQINATRGNAQGLFKKLDFNKLHNFKYLSKDQQQLARKTNAIPFAMQSLEIAYDPNMVDDVSFTIDLWNRELVKSLAIPDLSSSVGPAMIYVGDEYAKYRSTSSYVNHDLSNHGEMGLTALKELQPYTHSYKNTSEVIKLFKEKKIAVAVISSRDEKQIKRELPKLTVVVPGDVNNIANYQMISIPKNSKNTDLSYKYIDYRLSKIAQKKNYELTGDSPLRSGVITKTNYNPNAVITMDDLPEKVSHFESWQKQWNQIFQ